MENQEKQIEFKNEESLHMTAFSIGGGIFVCLWSKFLEISVFGYEVEVAIFYE